MPQAEELPDALRPLSGRQAIRVTLERLKAGAQGLVGQIRGALAEVTRAHAAATEAERQAVVEAERRGREAEAAQLVERERQEAKRARQQALAGMSLERITGALGLEQRPPAGRGGAHPGELHSLQMLPPTITPQASASQGRQL